jgi:DNA-binding NarL/FixJ family response regulator
MTHATPLTVVLIEDEAMFRGLLKKICRSSLGLTVVGEAGNAEDGLALCRELNPGLVLLDLNLPDREGLTIVPDLAALTPAPRILALSGESDQVTIDGVAHSGVHGFVDKNRQSLDDLQHAIGEVAAGRGYFAEVVTKVGKELLMDPGAFPKLLTDREREMLAALGRGLTNAQAAKELGVTANTVQSHRDRIMHKLGLHRTVDLIGYAVRKGFSRLRSFRP